jgi:hypothetical protein
MLASGIIQQNFSQKLNLSKLNFIAQYFKSITEYNNQFLNRYKGKKSSQLKWPITRKKVFLIMIVNILAFIELNENQRMW